ncbi:TPA: hypothetical protein R4423_001838, partial [Campylobacter jejuni]|nr:hypothetical protein [Campylobacter jejuni]HED4585860.1 hypothetical protein [Campylobacter jejuni]
SQSGTSTSINTSQNETHTISSTNNTLIIESSGIIQVSSGAAVDFKQDSSTASFINKGLITSNNDAAGIKVGNPSGSGATIETFINEGTIGHDSSKFGVKIWEKSTINNFNNSGTIAAKLEGVSISGNLNIQSFTNSGLISAGKGVNLGQGTMTNFTNASGGTIQGTEAGVVINTKIDTFTNNGFINSPGSGEWSNGIWISGDTRIDNFSNTGTIQGGGNGIYMNYGYSSGSYIKNFSNTGTIKGEISGIILANSTIDNFTNDGLIESTGEYGAIDLQSFYQGVSLIKTLENKGTIKGLNDGIIVETGNKIETLVNKGAIEATNGNGISFYFMQHAATEIDLGNIILENGSKIIAGNNGINVDITQIDASNEQTTIKGQGIDVKKGASVIGKNGAGIYIGDGQELNTQITIAGEVSGGAAGIVNEGIIGGSSD